MVSFTCNYCQDVVKKPKVQSHAVSCGCDTFTCVDCMHVFDLNTIKAHTSCVTEEEKYQGKWKQKLGSFKSISESGDAPRNGIKRPPRAPMNDLTSSEGSDDDWATRRNNKNVKTPNNKMALPSPKAKKHPSPIAYSNKQSFGASRTSEDDEQEEVAAKQPIGPAQKKLKTTHMVPTPPLSRVALASNGKGCSPPSRGPPGERWAGALEGLQAPHDSSENRRTEGKHKLTQAEKRGSPLLLPRSTTSTECIVPSFVLGTSGEVADIVADVLSDRGVSSMLTGDLSKEIVMRYVKRIAKSVRHAIETAAELGVLTIDSEGKVSTAGGQCIRHR